MAAALNLIVPLRIGWIVVLTGAAILALQVFGSYETIRNVFRWLALALLAYVGALRCWRALNWDPSSGGRSYRRFGSINTSSNRWSR